MAALGFNKEKCLLRCCIVDVIWQVELSTQSLPCSAVCREIDESVPPPHQWAFAALMVFLSHIVLLLDPLMC